MTSGGRAPALDEPDAAPAPRPGRAARGLAGAAALIGVLTVLARLAGFGRQLVLNATVGPTHLGTAYTTANYVPNIVFDVVAGGALASLVVPVLALPVARAAQGDRDAGDSAARTASALLSWTLLLLVPVAALGALAAGPLMHGLLGSQADTPGMASTATRMLLLFLPQIVLYGLAVVSSGILQAHQRFLAAAAAPLVSSVVVAATYAGFAAAYPGNRDDLTSLPGGATTLLGAGTTLGVLALALCTLLPLRSTGLRLRPTLRFPDGVAPRVRALALAGAATLVAQQLATVVVLWLSNEHGTTGAAVVYQNAWMVYVLPYAVLAVPIATSAFPRLSRAAEEGRREDYAATAATTTRAVLLVSWAGAAVLAAAAWPVARFFARIGTGGGDPAVMARALVAFAPGLVGYGLVAHLGRSLYALGRGRASAWAVVAGWAVVAVADVVLVEALPAHWTVAALGLGNTLGMTVSGVALAFAMRSAAGPATLRGCARTCAAGAAGAVAGAAAGGLLAWAAGSGGAAWALLTGAAAAVVGLAVFGAVVLAAAGADVRALVAARVRRGTANA